MSRATKTGSPPLVDETLGTAIFIDLFRGLPDTYMFRMVGGQITNMHAIIICDPTCAPPASNAGTDGPAPDASGAGGAGGSAGGGGSGGGAGTA
jgi:hypothetical protein